MDYRGITGKAMKGTTTVGIVCSDGVVLGADSRATMDTFISSSSAKKVHKIDENLGVTIAGVIGDASYIVKILKTQNEMYKMNEGKPLSPTSATSLLSLLMQENKGMPFIVQLVIGGLNGSIPEAYSIDPYGGYVKETTITSTGSGSPTALGYLEEVYKKDITTHDAIKDAARAIRIAMKRDSATGDGVSIAVITKAGYKEYAGADLEKMLK
jgi:proteasome beta subunit